MKTLLIINIDESQEPLKFVGTGFETLFLNYSGSQTFQDYLYHQKLWWFDFQRDNRGKWKNIKLAIESLDYFGGQFSQFWFPDPDLEMTTEDMVGFLNFADEMGFGLCQPSLTADSPCSHQFLKNIPGSNYRQAAFVEIMCPLFTMEALRKNIWTFDLTHSGYGIDLIWGRDNDCWVIDKYQIRHSRPPQFEETARRVGFPDPREELRWVREKYLGNF